MLGAPTSPEPAKPVTLPRTSPWRFFQFGSLNIALPGKALRAVEANERQEEFRQPGTDGIWCYEYCDSQQRPKVLVDIEGFLIAEEGLVLPDSTGNEVHLLEIADTEFALLLRGHEVELDIPEAEVIWSSTERRRRWLSGVSVENKVVIIDLEGLLDIAVERKRK
jgi:hypothetical protein